MQNTETRKPIEVLSVGAQTNRNKRGLLLEQQLGEIEASLKTTHDEDKFRQEIIAGCEVDIPCGKDELKAAERKNSVTQGQLQAEAREVQTFEDKVRNTTGYTPIAVIPAELWKNFCIKCNLWRFEHLDGESRTYVNDEWSGHIHGTRVFTIVLWVIALIVGCIALFNDSPTVTGVCIIVAGVGILTSIVLKIISLNMKMTSRRFLMALQDVWPWHIDEKRDREQKQFSYQVQLPKPPIGFAQKLIKLKQCGLQPCIAATPEALTIHFDKPKREAREVDWAEPVLYVTNAQSQPSNNTELVAILDQFGDFPDEKEAVRLAWECSEQYYAKF
ncbi:MAG: hypothetical protein WCV85_05480 [Patescibacteria group bacterium]|jgi:hypothetical protein